MFLEPHYKSQRSGWIEVICGSMFSGKTEELLRRLKRAQIARLEVLVFKPKVDDRYSAERVVSHDAHSWQSVVVERAEELLPLCSTAQVIGIDEAQFFDNALPQVCQALALDGKRVIVAGLDMDYRGEPFGSLPQLLAVAEYITKVHAICPHCGSLATHSYRKTAESQTILLGEKEVYEPRCRVCFQMGNILDFGRPS